MSLWTSEIRVAPTDVGAGTPGDPYPWSAIQDTIDDLPAAGGRVHLHTGTWAGSGAELSIAKPVIFDGCVRESTILKYTGVGKGIHLSAGSEGSTLKDFTLNMPLTGGSHGIHVNKVEHVHLHSLNINGVEAGDYGILFENASHMDVDHIHMESAGGHGIGFLNTDGLDYYGNGHIANVAIHDLIGSAKGVHIQGDTGGSIYTQRLLVFSHIQLKADAVASQIGLHLENTQFCSFFGLNIDTLGTAIQFEGRAGSSMRHTEANSFFGMYLNLPTTALTFNQWSRDNNFFGGKIFGGIIADANQSMKGPNMLYGTQIGDGTGQPAVVGILSNPVRTVMVRMLVKATTGAPSVPDYGEVPGTMVWNTADGILYIRDMVGWKSVTLS